MKMIKKIGFGIVLVYLITMVTYVGFIKTDKFILNESGLNNAIKSYSLLANLGQDFKFKVPYYFAYLDIPPSDITNPYLVGNITGEGVVQSIAFQAGYYGIAVAYSCDDGEIIAINNADCLKEWGADSKNAENMPVSLLYYKSKYDLAIAVNTPILFKKSFKLYFLNSEKEKSYQIRSLHLYGYFKNMGSGNGNKLKV
jgi:hypothetical protein